jgi:predicted nucleic acid-binding protein
VLLDTGPLVAFLDRRDEHHDWAVSRWGDIRPPLLTSESVISEACFLLRAFAGGREGVFELLLRGAVAIGFRLDEDLKSTARLMARYANVPMSVADASLVRMAERLPESAVLTVDADFRVYRKHGRQVIPTILPRGR